MAEIIRMPKMSDTMTDGVIAAWHKKVGDKVKSGEVLAEVETDKATMELESYEDGTLLFIGPGVKESVPVDGVLAVIGKEGENIDNLLKDIQGASFPIDKPTEENNTDNNKKEVPPAENKGGDVKNKPTPVDLSGIKAEVIRMPKMSDTMTEGTIVAWHKKVGDLVKSGDLLAEVATDKATMELESYEDGTLLYIGVKEGDAVEVDGVLAVIGEKGTDFQPLLNNNAQDNKNIGSAEQPKTEESVSPIASTSEKNPVNDARLKASPLAKKLAIDKGFDINAIKGSGESGRITKKDVESFVPGKPSGSPAQVISSENKKTSTAPATSPLGQESFEEVPVSQMRKVIAKRLGESLFTAPHFYLTMEINMDKAVEARNSMNEFAAPSKISFNDMVIKATTAAIRKNPKVNSSWLGDKIRYNNHIHIGVAVAVEEGLVVPVLRFADSKSLSQISAEVKELGAKAKSKKLQPSEMTGNTFSISNLGMFGLDEFSAIINSPDACILAVGAIKQTPVVKDGQIKVGNIMKVTLSCDHRVVDGAIGSAFLQTLKGLLEDPVRILV